MSSTNSPQFALDDPGVRENVDLLFRFAFWLFVGAISFSVAGMLLLRLFPSTMDLFGPVYTKLVKTPTWTFMTMLGLLPVLMYAPDLGKGRMAAFVGWGCLVGGAAELIGTTGLFAVGDVVLPFGEYRYTEWLGPKILGHVPYFIPPSWFAMSIVSLDLARRVTGRRWQYILLGSAFMVLWDVSLDPAMNRAFPFWEFGVDGFFFGMPLSNWIGWFVVTLVILIGYEAMRGGRDICNEWALWVYLLNCLFPLSISLLRDLYLAVLFGGMATAIPLFILWRVDAEYLKRSLGWTTS